MARPPRATSTRDPACGFSFDGDVCAKRGEHVCAPRVAKVVGFFAECLTHTKGRWARRAFVLAAWQANEIITPLFGTVRWDTESRMYVRRYRIAWLELARKNGKSELLAAIAIYLIVADEEQGAEVFGCACDRDQARKVFDVAERMVMLSPVLAKRLKLFTAAKRIVDEATGSFYEIIASDPAGNLGHNPHGTIMDETITQRDNKLWSAMRTAMGARVQPLMIAATTAGDDERSFAAAEHAEMARIADNPDRAPHVFVFMRNTPRDADPWDEANWAYANPALGDFLSLQALRDEATEARNDPSKENAFRQFRLNQWVSQATRWIPMHLWDATCGNVWLNPDYGREALRGRTAFGGLDLSARFDLTAWCLVVPGANDDDPTDVLWRFWLPEGGIERLDRVHDGAFTRWARQGWVTVTDGSVLDYDRVIADIAADADHFTIAAVDCDEWSMWPIINRVADACGLDVETGEITAYRNSFERMSPGLDDVMALVKAQRFEHHANPLARFCFDACEVKTAPYDAGIKRPVKPNRAVDRSRIDAVPAAVMAVNAWRARADADKYGSAYEEHTLMVL